MTTDHRGHLLLQACSATFLLASTAAASAADAPNSSPESAYFDEMPVVLAGARLPQRLDASPVAISVVDREMIEASGARELEDVLRLAPGMLVGHADGSTAFVTYHAIADHYARRMQVLVDGRSVYSPAFGGVDWSNLPITVDDIERVEIVRGPNAAAYGANAYLGTISITTRRAHAGTAVTAEARTGSDDVSDQRLTAEHIGGRWSTRVTAAQTSDDGFDPLRQWLDSERTSLVNARFDVDLGEGGAMMFETGATDGWRSAGRPTRKPDPPHDRTTGSSYYNLRWSDALSADSELSIALFDAQDSVEEVYDTLKLGAGSAPYNNKIGTKDYSADSRRTDLEVQHVIRVDEGLRLVYGASARVDRVRSPGWLGTSDERRNTLYRAFGHAEWQASDDWLFNLGAMYEDTDLTDPGLSPRISATYALADGHSLRVGASEASRTPVLVEQFADQSVTYQPGNLTDQALLSMTPLRPETITSYEVAYLGSFPQRRLLLDVRAFHDELEHLITYYVAPFPDPDGTTKDFANTDHAAMDGIEAQLDWRPADAWRVVTNYSYTDFTASDVAEGYDASTPANIASLLVDHRFEHLEVGLGVYYRSSYDGLDNLDLVPEHARVDLRFALPIGPPGNGSHLELVVQGLEGAHLDSRNDMEFAPRVVLELNLGL